jgi:hypothetical protein
MVAPGRALTVVAGVALLAACTSSSSPTAETVPAPKGPGTPLFDGFEVAAGSRLVGPVFTTPKGDGFGESSTAIVAVERDPVAVYDAYAEQARRAGFTMPGSAVVRPYTPPTCGFMFEAFGPVAIGSRDRNGPSPAVSITDPGAPPGTTMSTVAPAVVASPPDATALRCGASVGRADGSPSSVAIDLRWGGTQQHAVLESRPGLELSDDSPDSRVPTPSPLPPLRPLKLATKAGELFGTRNNAFDSGYGRFVLEKGSRVVAEVPDRSLLFLDGDAHEVLEGYARQLGGRREPPPVQRKATSKGDVLVVENGPLGGGGAVLLTDPSRRWLLVYTTSD